MVEKERQPIETREWGPTGYKIMVTGYTGLVGSRFVEAVDGKDSLIGFSRGRTFHPFPFRERGVGLLTQEIKDKDDISKVGSLIGEKTRNLLLETKPTLVLHFAAMADVDRCQDDPWSAQQTNVSWTRELARACREFSIPFGFCSTDYVFPGGSSYQEGETKGIVRDGQTGVENIYSKTKIHAEEAVERELFSEKLGFIFRITFPYDPSYTPKPGTAVVAFRTLAQGKEWLGFEDLAMTVTYTPDIAYALNKLILEKVWEKDSQPIYHVGGPEVLSGFDVARVCVEELRRRGLDISEHQIQKCSGGEFFRNQGRAPRPVNGGLKTDKIKAMGIKMMSLEQAVSTFPLPQGLVGAF